MSWLSKLVDRASDYFAHRKGLLPLIGIVLVMINFVLPFLGLSLDSFLVASNLFFASRRDRSDLRHDARLGVVVFVLSGVSR